MTIIETKAIITSLDIAESNEDMTKEELIKSLRLLIKSNSVTSNKEEIYDKLEGHMYNKDFSPGQMEDWEDAVNWFKSQLNI